MRLRYAYARNDILMGNADPNLRQRGLHDERHREETFESIKRESRLRRA
jgi:hypothetical protein